MFVIRPKYFVLVSVLLLGLLADTSPTAACMMPHSVFRIRALKTPPNFVPDDADVVFIGSVQKVDMKQGAVIFRVEKSIRRMKEGDLYTAKLLPNSFQCGQLSPKEIWWVYNIPVKTLTVAPPMPQDFMKNAITSDFDGSNSRHTPEKIKEKFWKGEWGRQFQHQETGIFLRDRYGFYDEGTSKVIKDKYGDDIAASKIPVVDKEPVTKP